MSSHFATREGATPIGIRARLRSRTVLREVFLRQLHLAVVVIVVVAVVVFVVVVCVVVVVVAALQ